MPEGYLLSINGTFSSICLPKYSDDLGINKMSKVISSDGCYLDILAFDENTEKTLFLFEHIYNDLGGRERPPLNEFIKSCCPEKVYGDVILYLSQPSSLTNDDQILELELNEDEIRTLFRNKNVVPSTNYESIEDDLSQMSRFNSLLEKIFNLENVM